MCNNWYATSGKQGISLYITFMVMSILLGIALGLSAFLISQFQSLRGVGYSAFSLEAADAGIEKIYYDDRSGKDVLAECPPQKQPDPSQCFINLPNGASYAVSVVGPGVSGCPAGVTYCAKSTGTFQSSQRRIRIAR